MIWTADYSVYVRDYVWAELQLTGTMSLQGEKHPVACRKLRADVQMDPLKPLMVPFGSDRCSSQLSISSVQDAFRHVMHLRVICIIMADLCATMGMDGAP